MRDEPHQNPTMRRPEQPAVGRPLPALVTSAGHTRSGTPTTGRTVVRIATRRTCLQRARGALCTQLAALEGYYRMPTSELIAQRESDTLPARIPRSEAARWAELRATLERLDTAASRAQAALEEREAERPEAELEAA
jgi:hypothetical protein